MMVFCTLFDSNYLDKGIVLYKSLIKQTEDFKLYILAMDDASREILTDMKLKNVIVIAFADFDNDELRTARSNRSRAEFCWTCSSCIIEYVLEKYQEEICTYVDADLFFYKNPQCLFDEFNEAGASIGIIEHRNNSNYEGRFYDKMAGPYCVEFNTFKNNEPGRVALTWWKERCLECCSADRNGKTFGDQKYLEDWPTRFPKVHVYKNLGAGMAPWNIAQYRINNEGVIFAHDKTIDPIFYHFHGIEYYDAKTVNIHVYYRSFSTDSALIEKLYRSYFTEIEEVRNVLANTRKIDLRLKKDTKPSRKKTLKESLKGKKLPDIILAVDIILRGNLKKRNDTIKLS